MAALGLWCCVQAFSSCAKQGLLSRCSAEASHYSGVYCCRAWVLGTPAQQLWCVGLVAPQHVESSRTRDQTCVLCFGRQILNYWTTREVLNKNIVMGISLVGQRLRLHLPMQEAQVQSLVEELGSHMLCSQKLKQYYNKFNKGLKNFLKNMLMKE